ncbi:MAG: CDP-diacylglycerol--glycerol-3-phosphate 3-phosphatidyltransferase [Clostridia bacterium]|nr:CDP-diacylglycerol--glycerol-3-phosphate 3-phosphatidyltransferase [Clostridia bacterium]
MSKSNKILNVPNTLSLLRMVLVPVFAAAILYLPRLTSSLWVSCLVPAALFGLTSLTDMLDGQIARKYDLITDFGKFLDPLADKFMVFGALVCILISPLYAGIRPVFVWVTLIVMLRELGVTSMRLVVASRKVVVAASFFGKAKTCTQIAGILLILCEPLFGDFGATHVLAYVMMAAMLVTTVGSGVDYLRTYWPYLSGRADRAETAEQAAAQDPAGDDRS